MRLAKAAHSVFLFTGQLIRSSLGDGANGAGTGAGTAINAGTLVDLANAAGILDGTDRAGTHAGTAADAGIANFESHSIVPPDRIFAIRPLQPHAVLGMANYRPVPQPVYGYYSILSQKIKRFAKAWCRPPQKSRKGAVSQDARRASRPLRGRLRRRSRRLRLRRSALRAAFPLQKLCFIGRRAT